MAEKTTKLNVPADDLKLSREVRTGSTYESSEGASARPGDPQSPHPSFAPMEQAAPQPVGHSRTPVAGSPAAMRATGRLDESDEDLTAPLDAIDVPDINLKVETLPLWGANAPPFTALMGAAGSGKTFAVKEWARRERGMLLCATTGIAAINLGGTTINAQLGYFDTKSLQDSYTNGFLSARLGKLWRAGVKRLVVDEVSMLDGDQLTYLVKGLEEVNGRGYVLQSKSQDWGDDEPPAMGLTLVGDFAQLPPVKAPFAFESSEWGNFADHVITLTEIRRQADPAFIEALRAARLGQGHKALDYFGPLLQTEMDDSFGGPSLLAKNDSVDRYNWIRMNRLPGADVHFESAREGKQRSEWGSPDKPPHTWGIPPRLHLKIGALVMILANKRRQLLMGYEYVNGDLGEIVDANETTHLAYVKLQRTGDIVGVDYVRREVLIPLDAARRKELIALGQAQKIADGGKWEIAGWISYMPLRVAYASTVHKSQGLSLDKVQVNIRDAFFRSPGMIYVALSRARTAGGLRLVGSAAAFVERCTTDPRLKEWL